MPEPPTLLGLTLLWSAWRHASPDHNPTLSIRGRGFGSARVRKIVVSGGRLVATRWIKCWRDRAPAGGPRQQQNPQAEQRVMGIAHGHAQPRGAPLPRHRWPSRSTSRPGANLTMTPGACRFGSALGRLADTTPKFS